MMKAMAFDMPYSGKRWRLVVFVVFCSSCRAVFPFDSLTPDGNRSDGGVDSSLDVIGMADSDRATDLVLEPESLPCIFDDFNEPMLRWKVSPERGDWSWYEQTSARLADVSYVGGHAMVKGSLPMVHGFVAKSTATVHETLKEDYKYGAGLSLVISEGTEDKPYRQVFCIGLMDGTPKGPDSAGVSYFSGDLWKGPILKSKPLDFTIKGNQMTYTLEVTQDNNVWMATCTVENALGQSGQATADISSIVDSDPLGVALFTAGVSVDFENVKVCPVP